MYNSRLKLARSFYRRTSFRLRLDDDDDDDDEATRRDATTERLFDLLLPQASFADSSRRPEGSSDDGFFAVRGFLPRFTPDLVLFISISNEHERIQSWNAFYARADMTFARAVWQGDHIRVLNKHLLFRFSVVFEVSYSVAHVMLL